MTVSGKFLTLLGQATSDVLKIVIQARAGALGPMRPSFNLVRILRQGLLKSLPPDAHKICNGRLHVSLTRFSDGKNVLVSQFDSMNDLVQVSFFLLFSESLWFTRVSFLGLDLQYVHSVLLWSDSTNV